MLLIDPYKNFSEFYSTGSLTLSERCQSDRRVSKRAKMNSGNNKSIKFLRYQSEHFERSY